MAAPRDQEARERAQDPRGSFHLEAPAGSGKTAVLLARFLTLLARINDSPRELLALTFTRQAAGEFRERAMRYFWSREKPESDSPPHERRLLELSALSVLSCRICCVRSMAMNRRASFCHPRWAGRRWSRPPMSPCG